MTNPADREMGLLVINSKATLTDQFRALLEEHLLRTGEQIVEVQGKWTLLAAHGPILGTVSVFVEKTELQKVML